MCLKAVLHENSYFLEFFSRFSGNVSRANKKFLDNLKYKHLFKTFFLCKNNFILSGMFFRITGDFLRTNLIVPVRLQYYYVFESCYS